MTATLPISPDAELVEWARKHGPDHLRFAAERGRVARADVMAAMVQLLAEHLGGRVLRPDEELINWQPRRSPNAENLDRADRVSSRLFAWWEAAAPACLTVARSEVMRVEEQMVVTDPTSILKYSGVVVTLTLTGNGKWFVIVNLEAARPAAAP